MKVKDIVKKINYATARLPVYMQEGISGEQKEVKSFDFAGYHFDEQDKTVTTISLCKDKMIIYYK